MDISAQSITALISMITQNRGSRIAQSRESKYTKQRKPLLNGVNFIISQLLLTNAHTKATLTSAGEILMARKWQEDFGKDASVAAT